MQVNYQIERIYFPKSAGCWVERGTWVSWGKDVPKSRTMEWGGWKVRGTERRGARCRGVEEGTTRVEKRVFSDGFVWACSWIFLCLHWEAEMRCEQSKRSRNPQLGHRFWKHNWTFKLKQERCWWSFYAGDKMLAFLAGGWIQINFCGEWKSARAGREHLEEDGEVWRPHPQRGRRAPERTWSRCEASRGQVSRADGPG